MKLTLPKPNKIWKFYNDNRYWNFVQNYFVNNNGSQCSNSGFFRAVSNIPYQRAK